MQQKAMMHLTVNQLKRMIAENLFFIYVKTLKIYLFLKCFSICTLKVSEIVSFIDKLVHYDDSQHVAVYHAGRYFKLPVYYMGRLLRPCELQK